MKKYLCIFFCIVSLCFVGCANSTQIDAESEQMPPANLEQTMPSDNNLSSTTQTPILLKIGVMSAIDSAPVYLAAEKGYFEEQGVAVEIVLYTNGVTKEHALQAGEVDAAYLSLTQFINNRQDGLQARVTTLSDCMFPIVMSPMFEEQKEVKVGVLKVGIANYLTDRYLADYEDRKSVV